MALSVGCDTRLTASPDCLIERLGNSIIREPSSHFDTHAFPAEVIHRWENPELASIDRVGAHKVDGPAFADSSCCQRPKEAQLVSLAALPAPTTPLLRRPGTCACCSPSSFPSAATPSVVCFIYGGGCRPISSSSSVTPRHLPCGIGSRASIREQHHSARPLRSETS